MDDMPAAVLGYIKKFVEYKDELVIHIGFPRADANGVHKALGGFTNDGESRWVGIGLIEPAAAKAHMVNKKQPEAPMINAEAEKAIKEAGVLCKMPIFWQWLDERVFIETGSRPGIASEKQAADFIRRYTGVESRADFRTNRHALVRWMGISGDYHGWAALPKDE